MEPMFSGMAVALFSGMVTGLLVGAAVLLLIWGAAHLVARIIRRLEKPDGINT